GSHRQSTSEKIATDERVEPAQCLGAAQIRAAGGGDDVVPLEVPEHADAPRTELELRAERVKEKVAVVEADRAVVVEIGASKGSGKTDAQRQVEVEPLEAVGRAHRDGGGIRIDGIDAFRVGGERAGQAGGARRREHRTLKQIDRALREVVGGAVGARPTRNE